MVDGGGARYIMTTNTKENQVARKSCVLYLSLKLGVSVNQTSQPASLIHYDPSIYSSDLEFVTIYVIYASHSEWAT